jgi:large subunit ribosomal protein L44e
MKMPKKVNRYCPYCRKKTAQKVKEPSKGRPSSMNRGSKVRMKLRGLWRGIGNKGKYSRLKNQAKKKRKTSKKTNILYICAECGKGKNQKKGTRTTKLVIE